MSKINYYTVLILAPLLILTGIMGFLFPTSLMSGEPAYNIFHLIFGSVGLCCLLSKKNLWIIGFNILFGLIDLYQFTANYFNLFPQQYFKWKTGDDILHIIIGIFLVLVGLWGLKDINEQI